MKKERAAKIILDMINGAESTLGHSLSTVEINALKKGYCALNPEQKTNADRIRSMSDEELANMWCTYVDCGECPQRIGCSMNYQDCLKLALDYLKQEVQE